MRCSTVTVRLALLGAVLAILLGPASLAHADHDWNGYHWKTTPGGTNLTVADSLSRGFRQQGILQPVLKDWNAARAVSLRRTQSSNSSSLRRDCPMKPGQIRVCDADYGETWLGKTDLDYSGTHIVAARVRINSHWGHGASYRRYVLCHEIGHSLGLWHRSKGSSCLNSGQHPDGHDLTMLGSIYQHSDAQVDEESEDSGCPLCGSAAAAAQVHARRSFTGWACH
jgi:hypothetical protein